MPHPKAGWFIEWWLTEGLKAAFARAGGSVGLLPRDDPWASRREAQCEVPSASVGAGVVARLGSDD